MAGRNLLSPDEYLLRRITAFKYDENSPFPIPPDHLNPLEKDRKGISMYQESVRTPRQLADEFANKHGYLIARLQVRELQEIGLNPVLDDNGHVSIPELRYEMLKSDPNGVDVLKTKLAKLAAMRIVLRTAPKPLT